MNSNLLLAALYEAVNDFSKARSHSEKALEIAKEIKNVEGLSRAYTSLGNYARSQNEQQKAIRLYEMGLEAIKNEPEEVVHVSRIALLNNVLKSYLDNSYSSTSMILDYI